MMQRTIKSVAMSKKSVRPIRKRTLRHKHTSITYIDDDWLPLRFSSLVIRASSINERYGSIKEFIRRNQFHCVTNGELVIMSEMMAPPIFLEQVVVAILEPLGFLAKKDFVLLEERLARGVGDRESLFVGKEVPETLDLTWLESLLTYEGMFVWLR